MSKRLLDLMLERDVQWPDGMLSACGTSAGEVIFSSSPPSGFVYKFDEGKGWYGVCESDVWVEKTVVGMGFVASDMREVIISRDDFEEARAKKMPTEPASGSKKHSHYHKDVSHLQSIDVYRVLALFGVNDPALQHAVKKLLCGGQRGSKGYSQDLSEAVDSIQRAIQMHEEDEHAST